MRKLSLDELQSIRNNYLIIQELNNRIASMNKRMALPIKQDLKDSIKFIEKRISDEENLLASK